MKLQPLGLVSHIQDVPFAGCALHGLKQVSSTISKYSSSFYCMDDDWFTWRNQL